RREAGRSPGAVSNKIRDGREPQDRHGARPCHTPIDSAARGRDHRITAGYVGLWHRAGRPGTSPPPSAFSGRSRPVLLTLSISTHDPKRTQGACTPAGHLMEGLAGFTDMNADPWADRNSALSMNGNGPNGIGYIAPKANTKASYFSAECRAAWHGYH